ncbi:MAG: hypothetical protein ACFCUJ_10895 [Thiotrichales bacterium]
MKRSSRMMMTVVTTSMMLMAMQTVTAEDRAAQPLDQQTYQAAIQSFGVDASTAAKAAEQSVSAVAASREVVQPKSHMEEKFARVVENLNR